MSFLEELPGRLARRVLPAARRLALAPLPLLRALFHAITFGAGPQLPHLALAHGFGLLAALALRGVEHAWFFWLLVPAVVIGFLLASSARERFGRERRLERSQRRSIELRAIEQRDAELEVENARLLEVLGHRHDARSAVAAAGLRAERIASALRSRPGSPGACGRSSRPWVASRRRSGSGARKMRRARRRRRPSRCFRSCTRAWARSGCGTRPPSSPRAATRARPWSSEERRAAADRRPPRRQRVRGRRSALLEASGLAHTWPSWCRTTAPQLSTALRSTPLAPFATTKDGHAGLGLYTVERLVRASRGSLRLENRREGGALATVYLPSAAEVAPGRPADGAAR